MQKVKGKVKSLTEINHLLSEDYEAQPESKTNWKIIYKFDHKGNEIERISYTRDDQLDARYLSVYDQDNNLTEKKIFDSEGSLIHNSLWEYDSKGNKTGWTSINWIPEFFWKRKKSIRYTYKYDEHGNEIEESLMVPFGIFFSKPEKKVNFIYRYDESGNLIEENWYNPDGSFDSKFTYKYDEKGNRTEWSIYNNNNVLNGKSVFKYDDLGNKNEEKRYNAEGELTDLFAFEYDEAGNEIKYVCYNPDRSVKEDRESLYDDKGHMIKEIWQKAHEADYERFSYHYTHHDHEGNWLRKLIRLNEKPIEMMERIIEYY